MRFHVLGLPHTASNSYHCSCAYTQKVIKLCSMLTANGHYVIHYGNERSVVSCQEKVDVTTHQDLIDAYGTAPGRTTTYKFDINDALHRKFFNNCIGEIEKRKQKNDFLLCMWGAGHKPIADCFRDLITVEPGIGYAGGHFARWKVFESYAMLHSYYGLKAVQTAGLSDWYDWVIPNYFDPDDFDYSSDKSNYMLFIGRVSDAKGLHLAVQIARNTGIPLKVAGPGIIEDLQPYLQPNDPVEFIGFADTIARRRLMAEAKLVIAASMFNEPFCGVSIEAAFSGTPVICTDWGAMTENVLHGITGFRCRTFEQFIWAAENSNLINSRDCRSWALDNFSMDRVARMYEEFWTAVMNVYDGKGFYAHVDRRELNWLTREFPRARSHPLRSSNYPPHDPPSVSPLPLSFFVGPPQRSAHFGPLSPNDIRNLPAGFFGSGDSFNSGGPNNGEL
jgi:glycosyltransferase involved in cell wall biosynthesis